MSVTSRFAALRQIWQFDNRWHLLFNRLLFRRETVALYRLGDLRVLVDHAAGDPSGAPEVLTHAMYVDHLPHLLRDHPLRVLDLGANTGGFPLLLARHGARFERLVAVELNPRTCVRLRFNLEYNLQADITVVNAGICGQRRDLDVRLGEGSVADSLYAPSFNSDGTVRRVPGLTIDDVWARCLDDAPVDICKIDIEQAEYEVMANGGHDRLRSCRVVVIEIHDVSGHSPRTVVDALVSLGFDALPVGRDPSVHVFVNTRLRDQASGATRRPPASSSPQ